MILDIGPIDYAFSVFAPSESLLPEYGWELPRIAETEMEQASIAVHRTRGSKAQASIIPFGTCGNPECGKKVPLRRENMHKPRRYCSRECFLDTEMAK